METRVDLTQKTTILFSKEGHRRLTALAAHRGVSLGQLVREACATVYGIVDDDVREAAAGALSSLALPVGNTAAMKRESVPSVDDIMS